MFNSLKKPAIAMSCLAALAACGGGSTGGGGGGGNSFSSLANSLEVRADNLGFLGDLDAVTPTAPANVPMGGSASYAGEIALVLETQIPTNVNDIDDVDSLLDNAILGNMNASVNFGNDTVTGNATNFVDSSNRDWAGSARLGSGQLFRDTSDVSILADFDGTLTDPGGTDHVLDGGALAGFVGPGAAIVGIVGNDETSADGAEEFLGLFILEN